MTLTHINYTSVKMCDFSLSSNALTLACGEGKLKFFLQLKEVLNERKLKHEKNYSYTSEQVKTLI